MIGRAITFANSQWAFAQDAAGLPLLPVEGLDLVFCSPMMRTVIAEGDDGRVEIRSATEVKLIECRELPPLPEKPERARYLLTVRLPDGRRCRIAPDQLKAYRKGVS